MYDETLRQTDSDGTSFVDVLNNKGIVPGIKVDKGVKPISGTHEETATQGIEDLDLRAEEYYSLGA